MPVVGRRGRSLSLRHATAAILVLFAIVFVVLLYSLPSAAPPDDKECNCDDDEKQRAQRTELPQREEKDKDKDEDEEVPGLGQPLGLRPIYSQKLHEDDHPEWGRNRLAVIVPFRDRFEELLEFIPHMHTYFDSKKVRHKFLVMNQVDGLRFNRAALINTGFLQSEEICDYFAMHDVDLLPQNIDLDYSYPEHGPFHVAAPHLHPKYHYETFVGGILLLNNHHFRSVNGLSNKYWGWGKEDDEFFVRLKEANLTVSRPKDIHTGFDTFKHIHDRRQRPRDNKRYWNQKVKSRQRDRVTGLTSVQYSIDTVRELTIEGAPVTIINTVLFCDLNVTPWCLTPTQLDEIKANLEAHAAFREQQIVEGGKIQQPEQQPPTPPPKMDLSNLVLPKEWNLEKS